MISRLPHAPLTEVVFEMRWRLVETQGTPLALDPGYSIILDAFSSYARKKGFNRIVNLQPDYFGIGRGVTKRFYHGEDNFPVLQIGHGIYAANDSIDYEWSSFKQMAASGALAIIKNYPKLTNFDLNIIHLEIRYLNTFEEPIVSSSDLIKFINEGTEFSLSIPQFWNSSLLSQDIRGRLQIQKNIKKLPGSVHIVDLVSAKKEEIPVIRMENKVIGQGENLLPTRRFNTFASKLGDWLEKARAVTSQSFKQNINKELYKKFGGDENE